MVAVFGMFNDGTAVLSANMLRQLAAVLTEGGGGFSANGLVVRGGVRITGDYVNALKIAPGVSGLTVTANTGLCVVPAATTGAGGCILVNDSVKTITLATADGSQARYDRIVAQVVDTGAADSTYDIVAVTGTPAGSPAVPATPSNALSLGYVLVAAGANSPSGLTVTDTRSPLFQPLRPYSGFSMGREQVPTANTSSSSFTTLYVGQFLKRAASVAARVLVHTPSGTTGEVRLVANEIAVGSPLSVASNTFAYDFISGLLPTSIDWNASIDVKLQARLVSGAGPVGATFMSGYTF